MSRSIEEAEVVIGDWLRSDAVGMLLIHKGPRKDVILLQDRTIKYANLSAEDRLAVDHLFQEHNAFKVEAVTGKDGPDRIKVTRQL